MERGPDRLRGVPHPPRGRPPRPCQPAGRGRQTRRLPAVPGGKGTASTLSPCLPPGKFPKKKFPPPLHTGVQLCPNRAPYIKGLFPKGQGRGPLRRLGSHPERPKACPNCCNGKTLYRITGKFFCQTALGRIYCKVVLLSRLYVSPRQWARKIFAVFLHFSPVFSLYFHVVFTVPADFLKNCGKFPLNFC